jgi:pimeloyl-ACP methyl ester carboxylesterase
LKERIDAIVKIVTRILVFLGRLVAFVLALVLCLPVALLPKATVVPAWIWIPLFAINLALLVSFFILKPAWKATAIPLGGILVVGIVAVLVSQAFAMTPPITGADGKPLPGSIATLEQVNLNGSRQWISIRGKDTTKPVLLFLAGGPGGSQLTAERFALGGLEDHFVVVNWEQPGSGKSFDAVKRSTITPDRYIEDAHALTALLKQRFGQEKIYVLGESWGSALGIWLVQRYPQDYQAFIGTGQMVAFLENDRICYDFALNWAHERGDTQKAEALTRQGPPPYYGAGMAFKESAFLLDTYSYMNQNPAIYEGNTNTWRDLGAPEYGLYDKVSWFRGALQTLEVVYPQLWEVDFRKQATKLDVPIYFLIGRHDINAPTELAEQYFAVLEAPHKEIVWFEHSGHNPWVNESARFIDVMVNTVLAQTSE